MDIKIKQYTTRTQAIYNNKEYITWLKTKMLKLKAQMLKLYGHLYLYPIKWDLLIFVEGLIKHDVHILSTGGTARALKEANIPITDVSSYTGFPEIMDGRVKTLHPLVHGGILADRGQSKTHAINGGTLHITDRYGGG